MTGLKPFEIEPTEQAAFKTYMEKHLPFHDIGLKQAREKQRAFLEGGSFLVDSASPASIDEALQILAKQKREVISPVATKAATQIPDLLNGQPVKAKVSALSNLFGIFAAKQSAKLPQQEVEQEARNTPKKP